MMHIHQLYEKLEELKVIMINDKKQGTYLTELQIVDYTYEVLKTYYQFGVKQKHMAVLQQILIQIILLLKDCAIAQLLQEVSTPTSQSSEQV